MLTSSKLEKPKEYYVALTKAKEEELGLTHLYSHNFYKDGDDWVATYNPQKRYKNEDEIKDMIKQYAVIVQREMDGDELRYWVYFDPSSKLG